MPIAALLLLSAGAAPSPGLAAAFVGGLRPALGEGEAKGHDLSF